MFTGTDVDIHALLCRDIYEPFGDSHTFEEEHSVGFLALICCVNVVRDFGPEPLDEVLLCTAALRGATPEEPENRQNIKTYSEKSVP